MGDMAFLLSFPRRCRSVLVGGMLRLHLVACSMQGGCCCRLLLCYVSYGLSVPTVGRSYLGEAEELRAGADDTSTFNTKHLCQESQFSSIFI
jgi:hypothetical protein